MGSSSDDFINPNGRVKRVQILFDLAYFLPSKQLSHLIRPGAVIENGIINNNNLLLLQDMGDRADLILYPCPPGEEEERILPCELAGGRQPE